jgi:cyanophycin synthetase
VQLAHPADELTLGLAHIQQGLLRLRLGEIMSGVRRPGSRLLLGLGVVGDRQDDLIEKLAEIGARDTDVVAIGHKERYLRGRTVDELDALLRAGAERVGVTGIPAYPTEVDCLSALVGQALPGDVVGLMCHAQREEVYAWIAEHGGTPDAPETLAKKVRAAT